MNLNDLRDNKGARTPKKRIGRGLGSGTGKTSGKGQKGQKSRTGVSLNGYEGGQNPILRSLPKRGFKNIFRKSFEELTLKKLEKAISEGILSSDDIITENILFANGLVNKSENGIKLIGCQDLTHSINIEVSKVSKGSLLAVEKANGTVKIFKKV